MEESKSNLEKIPRSEAGWQLAASALCARDERYVMELENAVCGILDGSDLMNRVNLAALTELGRAIEDFPGAIWLARPKCLTVLCTLCRNEKKSILIERCLNMIKDMVKKIVIDINESMDPSLQCEVATNSAKHWAALRRRHPPRRSLALAQAEEAVLDGDVPLSVSGACTMIIDSLAHLVCCHGKYANAVNILILTIPFAREPCSGPSSQIIDDRWRLPRLQNFIESILINSNQDEIHILALRLACALGPNEKEIQSSKLSHLCRRAASDASLALNDPALHGAVLDLIPCQLAQEIIRSFTQASLAFPLLEALSEDIIKEEGLFQDLDSLVDALAAAVVCLEKTIDDKTDISKPCYESDQKTAFFSALLYGEDDDPDRERILIALAAEYNYEKEPFLSAPKIARIVTAALGVAASRDRFELVRRCAELVLRLTLMPGTASHCAEGLLFRVLPQVLFSTLDHTEHTVLLAHLVLPQDTRLTTAHFRRKAQAALITQTPELWRWLVRQAALSARYDERTRRAARHIVANKPGMDPWRELLEPGHATRSGLARFLFARDDKLRAVATSRLILELGLDDFEQDDDNFIQSALTQPFDDDCTLFVTPSRASANEKNGTVRCESFIAALETARYHKKHIPLLEALAAEACGAILGGAGVNRAARSQLCDSVLAVLEDMNDATGTKEALRVLATVAWVYGVDFATENYTDKVLDRLLIALFSKTNVRKEAAVAVAAIVFDRRVWLDDDEDHQINEIHLLPSAIARRFVPASGASIWNDDRCIWQAEKETDDFLRQDDDPIAFAVARAAIQSQIGELGLPSERWACSREVIAKCIKAEAAATRHDFVEALRQIQFWLACRGKRAEEALADGPWERALRRTLQRAPRGVYERNALGLALSAMTAVVSEMDADDKRWSDLWHSLLYVVAPAALGESALSSEALVLRADSEKGHHYTNLGQDKYYGEEVDAELLDERIASDFLHLLSRLAERTDSRKERSAIALIESPAGQLLAKLLLSDNTNLTIQLAALETVEAITSALKDTPLPKSWEILPKRVLSLAIRPHRDTFRGGACLRPALACARRLIAICSDSASLSTSMLTRLAADRDAILRAGAVTLMIDDNLDLEEILIQLASDAGESPLVRGAALNTLARRTRINEQALRSVVAELLRIDFIKTSESQTAPFSAPVFFGGAANLLLTICESQSSLAARGFALLSKYALDPEQWHAERYASDVFRCAGLELGNQGIPVSQQRHVWSLSEQFTLAGKGWQNLARKTWRKHAVVAQAVATAVARGIRIVLDSTSSDVLRKCVPGLTVTALRSLSSVLPAESYSLFAETAELTVMILSAGGLEDDEIDQDDQQQLALRTATVAARVFTEENVSPIAIRAAARLAHALCAHNLISRCGEDDCSIFINIAEGLSQYLLQESNDDDGDAIFSVQDSVALALAHVCEFSAEARCFSKRDILLSRLLTELSTKANKLQSVGGITSSNTPRKRELASQARAVLRILVLLRPLLLSPCPPMTDNEKEAVVYSIARAWEGLEAADKAGLIIGRTCFDEQLKRQASTSPLMEAALALVNVLAQSSNDTEDNEDDIRRALVQVPPPSLSERSRKRVPPLVFRVTELAVQISVGTAQSVLSSQRQARLSVAACHCLAPLAASPARSALLQGAFVGDLVQALRTFAAAANGPSLATVGRREAARAARARALELLRLLVALTMFPDTQAKVLLHSDTPELLLDLVHYYLPSKSTSTAGGSSPTSVIDNVDDDNTDDDADDNNDHLDDRNSKTSERALSRPSQGRRSTDKFAEATALLLRNLSLLRRNKGHVLAQPPLVHFLVAALASKTDSVFTAAATALWALVHHSEKARAQLKRDKLALRHIAAARSRIQQPLDHSSTAHRAIYALCDILSFDDNGVSMSDSPF
uniref:Uncharacterized protein n=1 Tax=Aureoumbra lagunensis TaxID=44058 RepID=A0A7S3K2Y0_9STRA